MGASLSSLEEQAAGHGGLSRLPGGVGREPCVTCIRIELGETICPDGICESCGQTPPSLQWMYPEGPPGSSRRPGGLRRRSRWLRSMRSSSTDRPVSIPENVTNNTARRLSMEVEVGWGVSQARLDRASLSYSYRRCQGELLKDGASQCVICLSEFVERAEVRRLSCLHLFHTSCVDAWLLHNRVCPVCRVDVEASAAQFRSEWNSAGGRDRR